MLGVLHMPGPSVEAIIVLSIVFVAAEIMRQCQGRIGLTARKPWIITFASDFCMASYWVTERVTGFWS
jgi:hypothetical protein